VNAAILRLQPPKEYDDMPMQPVGKDAVLDMLDSMIREALAEGKSALGDGRQRAAADATAEAYRTAQNLIRTHCRS